MIRTYYEKEWCPECLYLLAMLEYVCRENDVPICEDYDDLAKIGSNPVTRKFTKLFAQQGNLKSSLLFLPLKSKKQGLERSQ